MKRFYGMMPSSEVRVRKRLKDSRNLIVTIESGVNGWTVIYSDRSTNYKDVSATTGTNFMEALGVAKAKLGELTWVDAPIKIKPKVEEDPDEESYEDFDYGDEDAEESEDDTEYRDTDYCDEDK